MQLSSKKDLQADVICENRSSSIPPTPTPRLVVVSLARVHLGGKKLLPPLSKLAKTYLAQQEPGLATTLLRINVPWHWEPRQQHLMREFHVNVKNEESPPPAHQPQVPLAVA